MASAIRIKDNIYWVGAIDWDVRNFHGYLTQKGSTYNAYLVIDDKITLIDGAKKPFGDELLARVASVVPLDKIDYVIVNHVEKDHAGALGQVRQACPNARFVADAQAKKGLAAHYHEEWDMDIVKTGDTLSTGKYTFHFVQTPMVHWPDSMVTYLAEEKILFPNDAFGQHFATAERFDDEVPFDVLMYEAEKYYANIVLPFGAQVQKALTALGGLDIDVICPSHGLIWRKNIPAILAAYQKWSANSCDEKAVVVYDTMWEATRKMAGAICDGFTEAGIPVTRMSLNHCHISDVMAAMMSAKYVAIGSPTLNNQVMPSVAALMTYIKGLNPKDRCGIAFGSYGWSGQSVGIIQDFMAEMKWQIAGFHRLQYEPKPQELAEITRTTTEYLQTK